ncbi:DoxX family membrane protein [Bacteroidota bacterium]
MNFLVIITEIMIKDSKYFKVPDYTKGQLTMLVLLRVAIGWHFFYEGLVKVLNPNWSSAAFLMDSKGLFERLFYAMAANPDILNVVNFLNQWGLLIIGICLMVGLFEKVASIAGIALLIMYYLSHPSLIGVKYAAPGEGSYLLINKNLIEALAIGINIWFPNSRLIGFERLIYMVRNK